MIQTNVCVSEKQIHKKKLITTSSEEKYKIHLLTIKTKKYFLK